MSCLVCWGVCVCAVPIYEAKVNNENQVLLHAVKQDGQQGLDCHTDEKSR